MASISPLPVLVVLNLVTLGALILTNAPSSARPAVQDHIRARVIDIVDARGEMRVQLHVQENGGGGIRLYSGQGEIRSKFGTRTEGGAGLLLMDESTSPTVELTSTADGAALILSGPSGRRVIAP